MKPVRNVRLLKPARAAICSLVLICMNSSATEVYPTLTIANNVRTNVQVVASNPAEVIVTFAGGGATVKRQDLPETLRAKYPYDAEAAAKFESERAIKAKAQDAQSKADAYTALQRQEQNLQVSITKVERQIVEVQKEIGTRAAQAKGRRPQHPSRIALDQARDKRLALSRELDSLKKQLEANRKAQTRFR